jgi:hypothetical protein
MGVLDFLLGVNVPNWRVHGMELGPHQTSMIKYYNKIVSKHGLFSQGIDADGGHYILAGDNPFAEQGMKCLNCVFYINGDEDEQRAWKSDLPRGGCSIMVDQGELVNYIHPEGLCKLWVIPEEVFIGEEL